MPTALFQNFTVLAPNTAEHLFWERLKEACKTEPCVAYFRYPIFTSIGNLRKEPDVILLHREWGLWVFECKGCRVENIAQIIGHEWRMTHWHREVETPALQAEDGMFAVRSKLEERRESRGLLTYHYRVVLPLVNRQAWHSRGLPQLPCVLLEEDLRRSALREALQRGAQEQPQRPLTDAQWQAIVGVLGGILPQQEPRPIPTGTPANNPVRVIHAIEAWLRVLDSEQQKVAFEVPDGPQRIRGLAGTGKTVLLAKRAARIHAAHPDWEIGFVFFTRSLYEQIEGMIRTYYRDMVRENQDPNWERLQILHAWGGHERRGFYSNLALKLGVKPLTVEDVHHRLRRSCSPAEAFAYVCEDLEKQATDFPVLFDALLIDEGQDLPPAFYRLAYQTLAEPRRLYWAYDEAQGIGSLTIPRAEDIFGRHPDGRLVVDLRGNYPGGILKSHNLNRCYRTPRLLLMAAHAVNMGLLRPEGPLQGVTTKADWEALGYQILEGDFSEASVKAGHTVTITRDADHSPHPIDADDFPHQDALGPLLRIQTFPNEGAEQEWLAAQIAQDLQQGFQPWDLLVTCPRGSDETAYFRQLQARLQKLGIRSIIAGCDTDPDTFRVPEHVTLAGIHRAKGNEAWKVYACRFHWATQPFWRDESELHKRNEAFVALTRARVWCVVTGLQGKSTIFDELEAVVQQHPQLTFRAFNQASLQRVVADAGETDLPEALAAIAWDVQEEP
ncbi:MAG: hypothetical protein RMI89_05890 [Gloeomargarita sp. SKYBB_i_bin120]|nr:hypothetical protein [Gloeomargarita sp. SKYG98]MCS7292496.1 hypothetical protein [Gloeomargarita sp. SKYB120]MDW8178057.1 hypothetical protein [Gloeomargarita sp. SKYBB_i_bin120]